MASRNVAPEAIEIRLNGALPAFLRKVELMAKFFVSMALRANYAPLKWGLFIRFDSECQLCGQAQTVAAGAAPAVRGNAIEL